MSRVNRYMHRGFPRLVVGVRIRPILGEPRDHACHHTLRGDERHVGGGELAAGATGFHMSVAFGVDEVSWASSRAFALRQGGRRRNNETGAWVGDYCSDYGSVESNAIVIIVFIAPGEFQLKYNDTPGKLC